MPDISNRKRTLTVRLSEAGVARLDALKEKLGFRRSGTLLTAVRVCGMAHGCGNGEPIFYQSAGGEYLRLRLHHCRPFEIDEQNTNVIVITASLNEVARLKRCGQLAGDLFVSAETSLWVLERLTCPEAPRLFERRGSVYYPLLQTVRR